MKNISEKVKSILVSKLDAQENEVIESEDLRNDLGADSLDIIEILMEIEEEYNIVIPDEYYEEFRTYGDIVTYIKNMLK